MPSVTTAIETAQTVSIRARLISRAMQNEVVRPIRITGFNPRPAD